MERMVNKMEIVKYEDVSYDLSIEIANKINARRGNCFYNASIGLSAVKDGKYIIGYVICHGDNVAVEHGWIVADGVVIDPTSIIPPADYPYNFSDLSDSVYYAVLQFNDAEMMQHIIKNKDNPSFQKMKEYSHKMIEAQQIIQNDIGRNINFLESE